MPLAELLSGAYERGLREGTRATLTTLMQCFRDLEMAQAADLIGTLSQVAPGSEHRRCPACGWGLHGTVCGKCDWQQRGSSQEADRG